MTYRYKTVKIKGKTKLLHRHLVEQHIRRPLLPSEHVHHKNGDRHDNRIENLEIMSCKDHMHEHKQKHPEVKTCVICGTVFRPHPTKRARKEACTPACGYKLGWMKRRSETPPLARALVAANYSEQLEMQVAV